MDALRLAKHQGLGNDFLVALLSDGEKADLERRVGDLAELARATCDRHTGIGADGLILGTVPDVMRQEVDPTALDRAAATRTARVSMKLLNSDGSSAEVSGNGLACLVHEVARREISRMSVDRGTEDLGDSPLMVTVETADGSRLVYLDAEVQLTGDDSHVLVDSFAEVHMPNVVPGPGIAAELDEQISQSFGNVQRDTGNVGNPHLVINADRPMDARETARLGSAFEAHFADGINVEFIWQTGREDSDSADSSSIGMSVWERGAGLTQACGTGAVTAAVKARDWGLVEPSLRTVVQMPGGEATVSTDEVDGHPILSIWVEHIGNHVWSLDALSLES